MKSNKINYVIVGAFMLTMMVGLITAVALLTGRTGAADTYYTVYDNVTGIKFGTQVLYEGYPVGQVEEVVPIEEDGRMRFRVDMSVKQGWSIPDDSIAQVAAPGLLSAITVNIEAGKSPTALAPGERVNGQAVANLFAVMTSVANDVGELADNSIRPLLDNINKTVDAFGTLLEKDAQDLARELMALTLDLAQRAPKIADNIEELVAKMNESTDQLQAFLNPENREKLEAILDNMDTAADGFAQLTTDLKETRQVLDKVLESVGTVIGDNRLDVEKSVVDLRYVVDSIARHIDTMNQNLEGAARNMYEFSRQIRQNPGLLLGGTPPEDAAADR
jgi:phospholipid/cholesterol/gamma-HCH transport system substrate-binding protein